jgi:S1-C subfamily serine protease
MTRMRPLAALAFAASTLIAHAQDSAKDAAPAVPAAAVAIPANLENSVVKVFSTLRRPDPFKPWSKAAPVEVTGSGVVIEGRRILTNAHVVGYASQVEIQASQAGDKVSATVVAVARDMDLALLKLDDESFFDTHAPVARASVLPAVRDQVFAYGYPTGGNSLSITKGIVSRIEFVGYSLDTSGLRIQIDAAINPGNSGGPLADLAGRVIGVNVATSSNGSNVSFSIPSDQAQRVAQDLIARRSVDHPYLGVGFLTPLDAAENGRSFSGPGVLVTQVASGSPAAQAGLQVNDVVTAVDGTALDTSQTLGGLLGTHKVGEVVKLTVRRGGQTLTLDATLVQRPTA